MHKMCKNGHKYTNSEPASEEHNRHKPPFNVQVAIFAHPITARLEHALAPLTDGSIDPLTH
ncbi:MAG: hypothetical protein ACRC5V_11270 [Aeromonas sp.]